MPRIPLVEDLASGPIPPGSVLIVEYDPASQWHNASITITAGWLESGGTVGYAVAAQPPNDIRFQLNRLGANAQELEKRERLIVVDFFAAGIGQKSKEKYSYPSLKVQDLSIEFSRELKDPESVFAPPTEYLRVMDNVSVGTRFNDEKAWMEFLFTRLAPVGIARKAVSIAGIVRGVHSEWFYKTLEASATGIVDFKVEEVGGRIKNFMRIRRMVNVSFDSEWHELEIDKDFRVRLANADKE